jgi:hypothetical protein
VTDEAGNKAVIVSDTAPTEAQAVEAIGKAMKPHADRATLGAMMPMTPPSAVLESTKQHLPMLGAMAAGYATGGAGPMLGMIAEGAGAMAGSATADKLSGRDVDVPHALGEGAQFAAGSGIIRGLRNVADIGKGIGREIWSRASGEGRPQVIEDIMSRGKGFPSPRNSQALFAEDAAASEGVAEGVSKAASPLDTAARAHYGITKRVPSFLKQVGAYGGAGATAGGLVGGKTGAAIGGGVGTAVGALSHPYAGMGAGQALYGASNIVPKVAQEANPAVATEITRQLIALMLNNGQH